MKCLFSKSGRYNLCIKEQDRFQSTIAITENNIKSDLLKEY